MSAALTRLRHGAPSPHVSTVTLAVFWFAATLGLIGASGAPSAIAGAAAVILALTTVVAMRTVAASALLRAGRGPVAVSLRDQARRAPVSRQCDPDAPGRPRPRAPGACSLG